jgi:hypothetical protein
LQSVEHPSCWDRKEAPKENELSRISPKGERTRLKKLEWSNFSQITKRKSTKSMKERRPAAARRASRRHSPILFQIEAKLEQIGSEQAHFELFDAAAGRDASVEDALNELLLGCLAAGLTGWMGFRSACFGLLLADVAVKENELSRSGCFGERSCFLLNGVFECSTLVSNPVSCDKIGERRKAEILNQNRKIKNRFCFRISGFCFSPLYVKVTV